MNYKLNNLSGLPGCILANFKIKEIKLVLTKQRNLNNLSFTLSLFYNRITKRALEIFDDTLFTFVEEAHFPLHPSLVQNIQNKIISYDMFNLYTMHPQ